MLRGKVPIELVGMADPGKPFPEISALTPILVPESLKESFVASRLRLEICFIRRLQRVSGPLPRFNRRVDAALVANLGKNDRPVVGRANAIDRGLVRHPAFDQLIQARARGVT